MSQQQTSSSSTPGGRLRELLATGEVLVCPGVYDGLSTRLAIEAGFRCLYMTGAGVSMSRIGMADLGLATQTEMVDTAGMIASIDPSVPLIADADTGYGTTANVARTADRYISAGVAGFHLEDQVVNKKCGHLEGKECVGLSEYLARIRAAAETRRRRGSDVVLIARTDALATHGLADALGRLRAAVKAGADAVFLEAISTREQLEAYRDAFRNTGVFTLHNIVPGSRAYRISPEEARQFGINILIHPGICLMQAYIGFSKALRSLKDGVEEKEEEPNEKCSQVQPGPHRLFQACGMDQIQKFDRDISDWVQAFEEHDK
ncbi:methylisocitrate lyase [Xylariaceae sp. FL0594]|nr:methylisocitrate lyase [Xylariaceae sp. FL0594]